MTEKVVKFPHAVKLEEVKPDESETDNVKDLFKDFNEDVENVESVLIIGIRKDGGISWGASSGDLHQVVWLCEAMKKIAMDISLGLHPGGFNE